jgi:hypothetical protein
MELFFKGSAIDKVAMSDDTNPPTGFYGATPAGNARRNFALVARQPKRHSLRRQLRGCPAPGEWDAQIDSEGVQNSWPCRLALC